LGAAGGAEPRLTSGGEAAAIARETQSVQVFAAPTVIQVFAAHTVIEVKEASDLPRSKRFGLKNASGFCFVSSTVGVHDPT